MDDPINSADAKAQFSHLLKRAEHGEEIVISRAGKPVARLMPLAKPAKRKFGLMKGLWPEIADDVFFKPMSEEDIRWAEGYYNDENFITKPEYWTKPDQEAIKAWHKRRPANPTVTNMKKSRK